MQKYYEQIGDEFGINAAQVNNLLQTYVVLVSTMPPGRVYHYLGPELRTFYRETGLKDSDAFHRLAMARLIDAFQIDRQALRLPEAIEPLYQAEFARIRKNLEDDRFSFLWKNDLFAKDMGIASGRLFPVGPGLLEISGVPRSLLVRKDLGQFLRLASMMLFGLRGRGPLLTIHIHLSNVEQFNPEGWEKSYTVIGEILELNPEMKGLMRHAWFFDPVIAQISPKLAYLREIPQRHGAAVYYYSDEGADSGALTRSPTRRELFDKGEYTPRVYYLLWPRDRLISYARTL